MGLRFKVVVSDYEEIEDEKIDPHLLAKRLSLGKAKAVAKKHKNAIIIAADTFVSFRGKIMSKPVTKKVAKDMLRLLSGKSHTILTGFTILDSKTGKVVTKSVESKAYMKKLTEKEIAAYVATGEPLDKAGAYGIQERGALFVEKIEGDYFNIVGLPIFSLAQELKKFGVEVM